ncbi:MAG: hypothetical protein ACI9R3_002649 [Verrucomicrobiales bacterium]|jgi:hypothetical protein
MNKTVTCSVGSLIAGVGIGLMAAKMELIPQLATDSESEDRSELASADKASSGYFTGSSVLPSSKGGSSRGAAGKADVEALLELVDTTSSMFNRKLADKVQKLGLAEISAMAEALEGVPSSDQRLHQARTALYSRWAELNPDEAWSAVQGITNYQTRSQLLNIVIREIASDDFAKAREIIDSLEEGRDKQAAVSGLTTVGAKEQPEMMFEMLENHGSPRGYWQYQQLFQQWAKDSPELAMSKIAEIKGAQLRQQALNGLVQGLSALDPERGIEFAKQIENQNERRNAMNTAIGSLAATDPQRALEIMKDVPSGNQRVNLLGVIASNWIGNDPTAAMKWMESLSPTDRIQAVNSSIWHFAHSDPENGAKLLSKIPPSNRFSHVFSNFASQWAQSDSAAALAWASELPLGSQRTQAIGGLLNQLQSQEPERAASILSKEGITNDTSHTAGSIFGNWVMEDRDAALSWMEGLNVAGNMKQNMLRNAISNWAGNDPQGAAHYSLQLKDEELQKQAINSLMSNWGQNDPNTAHEWVQKELKGEVRDTALSTLIQNLTHNDHTMALSIYSEATAGLTEEQVNKSFGSAAQRIAGAWSQHDAPAAADWVLQQPEGNSRENAVQSVVDTWSDYDPVGASEFVGMLSEGKERDGAVQSLVNHVRQNDPESAFIWAETISDDSKRASVVRDAIMQWKSIDPDAAFEAAGRANISDEKKVSLLKSLQDN